MNTDPVTRHNTTPEQRDAVMDPWWRQANADGWEVDADPLYWAAVDGLAWNLLEQTMDTADREPSPDQFRAARDTAERILAARGGSTDNTHRAALAAAWERGGYAGREYQKRLYEYANRTHFVPHPEPVANPYRDAAHAPNETSGDFPDCEGWTCQSCGADNYIPVGFARRAAPAPTDNQHNNEQERAE